MASPLPETVTDAVTTRVHDETGLSADFVPSASANPGLGASTDARLRQRPLNRGKEGEGKARPADISVGRTAASANTLASSSPPRVVGLEGGPPRSASPFQGAISPGRSSILRSSSPRHLSPATSQIFERDVVDPTAAAELSPAIPSHIQTEDHIPPVLEASSLALTDEQLGQDDIEIVTHTAHEPAAATVTGSTSNLHAMSDSVPHLSAMSSLNELAAPSNDLDAESSSTYGVVDPADPRRLSFISFADVVHSEHQEVGHAPHPLSMSSTAPSLAGDRSPEPVRSPLSSPGSPPPAMSPLPSAAAGPAPTSGLAQQAQPTVASGPTARTGEASPVRGAAASSVSSGHEVRHGELTIETMRHAIQKTGSNNEAVGMMSAPTSAVGGEDGQMPGKFPV